MSWDLRWMSVASLVATWSKDRSRKCGAVIVDSRNVLVSLGWNGFPRGVADNPDYRHERPEKYLWTEHAERNAIYNAAANGHPTRGCTMHLPWFPCADCARAIIQAGITSVVCYEPDWLDPQYSKDFAIVTDMFLESEVNYRFIDGAAPVQK